MKTKVMGILNTTPDSFFDKGRFFDPNFAIEHAIKMAEFGADIIDIGGESTRPGAEKVDEMDELKRVIPILAELKSRLSIPLSIDTMKPSVARAAISAGATLINDVSGFSSPEMRTLAARSQVDICVMHMQGTPDVMQKNPYYEEGVIPYLIKWFDERIALLLRDGVKPEQIIIDPGIGFGKTVDDNLQILHNLQKLKALGFPVLLGISRKSFMGKILNKPPIDLLPTTIALNTLAILSQVDIIRVHDVPEHRLVVDLIEKFMNARNITP